MKKIITYGSFDLFHEGHRRILERAKALGDYLIVGVTTEHFDESRGKLNVIEPLMTRYMNVQNSGYCDEVIIEDHTGQKIEDIIKYNIDTFVIGSDWIGQFDYLKDYCNVVYLERTKDISSTSLRNQKYKIIKMGIIGTGRIANRFVSEYKYVSGISLESVYNPNLESAEKFAKKHTLNKSDTLDEFIDGIDAVYIASTHHTHYEYIKYALNNQKHVLCEKPIVLKESEAIEVYALAKKKKCILIEGIKIAYAPGFIQMLGMIRSGIIGNVRDVEACFTKLLPDENLRELSDVEYGGSFTELASYTLLPIIKLMGANYENIQFASIKNENGLDSYTKVYFNYKNGFSLSKTGLGVKSDGQLLISGTKGYIRAKSPWWLMKEFEICFEDSTKNETFTTQFLGSGLRYELCEFIAKINGYQKNDDRLLEQESIEIAKIIEKFLSFR